MQDVAEVGAPTYDFANISKKLHEIERIWTQGASLAPPSDPPLDEISKQVSLCNRKSRIISDTQKRTVCKVVDVLQYMSKFDYINVMIFNFRNVVPVFFPSRLTLSAAFVSTCIKIVA